MARPLRLEHPGAIWHVTSRGNGRQNIVVDDVDRSRLVGVLGHVVIVGRWRLHAWVVMTNHYHLLVETPEPNLARGMRQLNGTYAQDFNRRHERVGHLFQGRYKGILVEREGHLLELIRYVVLNPVRAAMVRSPAEYRWSSYAETAGLRRAAEWLEVDWTLAQFADRREAARRRFEQFVSEGRGADYRPWDELQKGLCLGSESFRQALAERSRDLRISPEVPFLQRAIAPRPSLEAVGDEVRRAFGATGQDMARRSRHRARKALVLLARRVANSRLAEVAGPLGLSPRSVSSLLSTAQRAESQDPGFRRRISECERRLWRGCRANRHPET